METYSGGESRWQEAKLWRDGIYGAPSVLALELLGSDLGPRVVMEGT